MRVVICGGGVIGASVAYFMSGRGVDVILVERRGLACAASGKAGAFLALDWLAGSKLDALARRSFALHARLPDEIEGDWGYQRLTTYGGFAVPEHDARRGVPAELDWLADGVVLTDRLGSPATTAVVHPAAFTAAMMGAAQRQGAELRIGTVSGVVRRAAGSRVRGVEVDDNIIEADAVVIAMGPWSRLATRWLPLPGVFAHQGHSLIFDTGNSVSADALFLEWRDPTGPVLTPEVFPRADGTTYVAISSSQDPLPVDPAEVRPDPRAIEQLQTICERLSPALVEAKVVARQACYRPVTPDGLPLIGRVPGVEGAYVATGHSVWGVLNAPASGEALAELIVDGVAHSTDLRPFDPVRLRPLDPHGVDWTSRA
jgi:glycine/D-amino acid oxidase-like deaminating enzyme